CLADSERLPEGRSWNRLCPGCEGSAMIFPARFLALDVYRSWMVGRSAPIILSADLTVRCNLFLSSLVAEPNQTVMNEQESADKHPYNHMGIRLSPIQPHGHTPTPADRHPYNHMGIRQTDT